MLFRLGSAFVLIGLILLIVYLVTFNTQPMDPRILVAGSGLCIIGLVFRRRAAARSRPTHHRFHTVRKLLQKEIFEED
jgi:archaellum biogenesis protein FlaJ (TadC family)